MRYPIDMNKAKRWLSLRWDPPSLKVMDGVGAEVREESDLYLVALSGGPDSVALLRIMLDEGYRVEAAHCNFHLRGAESDRDEAFCRNLCEKLDVKLHVVHFDTKEFAELRGVSTEMAARELRYRWISQLAHDTGAHGVCIAHHSDDQVETILLNILRGTGLKGLLGMQRKNGIFLRPLLDIPRREILEYLDRIGQDYVTDSTNLKDDVQRNKLRLDIIPMLEKVTPAARRNILRMADNLSDVENVIEQSIGEALQRCAVVSASGNAYSMREIRSYVSPRLLLWSIVSGQGFNREQTMEMLSSTEGGRTWTSQHAIAVISNDTLYIYDLEEWNKPLPTLRIPETGLYNFHEGKIRASSEEVSDKPQLSKERNIATIDADALSFPLTLRPVKEGDRFTPFGMRGSKLVSDYLKDKKIEPIERHHQLAVTDASGQIIWLPGKTIDESAKVKGGTMKVIVLNVEC